MTSQLTEATRRGSEVRVRRAQLKREVKAGDVLISELLIETAGGVPNWLEKFAIARLLDAMPRVSFAMGCELCELLRIPPLKTVGQMTYRQRREVADHIAKWEGSEPPTGQKRAVRKAFGLNSDAKIPAGRSFGTAGRVA